MPARLLTLLLLTAAAHAQPSGEVTGTVRDAVTGEPLPAATVQIEGTLRGTISNAEGAFALVVAERPATLTARYIGYRSASADVTEGQARVDLLLAPEPAVLGEIEVTDEDPGMRIMRRVIERKAVWQPQMTSYAADAYTRIVIRNDSGIVTIAEIASDLFWREDEGTRELIRAQRQTANAPFDGAIPAAATMVNFYGDEQTISGYRFVGVTHPDALDVYRFRLVGQRTRDGQTVFDIAVEPRSPLSVAFVGQVSVLDTEFALLEVRLRPGPVFRFPPPFRRFEADYVQQFDTFGGAAWVPVDLRSETVVEIGVGPLLRIPPFGLSRVSRLSDYRINAPTPDSLFAEARLATVDSAQVAADTLLDTSVLRVPLEADEERAYAEIDSSDTMEDAFRPSGALARSLDDGDGPDGSLVGYLLDWGRFAYNRVEGARVGLVPEFEPVDGLRLSGGASYSTGPGAWWWTAGAEYRPGRRWALRLSHRDGIEERYGSALRTPLLASAGTLIGGTDFYDYLQSRRTSVRVRHLVRGTRAVVSLTAAQQRTRPIARLSDLYTLYGSPDLRANPAVRDQTLRSATLAVDAGQREGLLGVLSFRRLQAGVEVAPPGLSDAAFTRAFGTVDTYVTTFGRRRLFPAQLILRATAQIAPSDLPLARYGLVESATTYTSPFGSLRTRSDAPYQGYAAAALFAEHNFRTTVWEALGWRWAADRNYALLVTGAAARTWSQSPVPATDLHAEAGVSISGLFDVLRVDVTARLDEPGWGVGVALPRVF